MLEELVAVWTGEAEVVAGGSLVATQLPGSIELRLAHLPHQTKYCSSALKSTYIFKSFLQDVNIRGLAVWKSM